MSFIIPPKSQFHDTCSRCPVRGSIYRKSNPEKKYPKNHTFSFIVRIPKEDHKATDWEIYDPKDDDTNSLWLD